MLKVPKKVMENYKKENRRKEEEEKSFLQSTGSFILEVIKVVIISLAIIIPVRYYLIQPFYVKGASMEETFHDYEYLIIDELSYRFKDPSRGDIIVLKDPRNSSQYFIKRIIGLPSEEIKIKNNKVTIFNEQYSQGTTLDESYYLSPGTKTLGEMEISLGSDEYFVLGDNREASLDSRVFGSINQDQIVGRAWLRAWPFDRITHFTAIDYSL